jgi:hypothetical protein
VPQIFGRQASTKKQNYLEEGVVLCRIQGVGEVVGFWACRKVPLLVNFLDVDILHCLLRDGLHRTKYVVLKNKFHFFSIFLYSRKEIIHLRVNNSF